MLSLAGGLGADEIRAILPHRYPFAMLDRIVELEPGRRGVGWKNISVTEPWFAGHYPEMSIFPGVLIIEAMGQLAGVVFASGFRGSVSAVPRAGYLAAVRSIKFTRLVRPGDRLVLTAALGTSFGNLTEATVSATVDREPAASGRLAFAVSAEEISET